MSAQEKQSGWFFGLTLGRGTHWDANSDFGPAVKLGFVFIAAVVLVLWPWMHFAMKHQAQSYQAAVRMLEGKSLREIPAQRAAELRKKGDFYRWRMVVWEKTAEGEKPRVFSATVDKAQDYRVIETTFEPYTTESAGPFDVAPAAR